MELFSIFILLSYLIFCNPHIRLLSSQNAVYLRIKSDKSFVDDKGIYREVTEVKLIYLFKFK